MLSLSWKARSLVCMCNVLMESDRDLFCPDPAWWSENFWWPRVPGLCVPMPWVSSGYVGALFVAVSPKGVFLLSTSATGMMRMWPYVTCDSGLIGSVSFPPEPPSQWLSASTLLIFCYLFSFGFNPHPLLQLCLSYCSFWFLGKLYRKKKTTVSAVEIDKNSLQFVQTVVKSQEVGTEEAIWKASMDRCCILGFLRVPVK